MQALCCSEAGWAQMGKYDHDSRNSGAFLILKPNSTIHHISREVIGETEGGEQDTWKPKPVSSWSFDQLLTSSSMLLSPILIHGLGWINLNLLSFQSLSMAVIVKDADMPQSAPTSLLLEQHAGFIAKYASCPGVFSKVPSCTVYILTLALFPL